MSAKAYHQASAGETETKNFRKDHMSPKVGWAVDFFDWVDAFIRTHSSNESGKVILPFLSNPKVTLDEPPCPSVADPA